MNLKRLIAAATVLLSQTAISGPVTFEAGVALVESSGLRRYAAKRFLTTSETSAVTAPQLRVSMPVGESMVVGIGYAHYGTFRGRGVAPSSDIFDEGIFALTVITPFRSAEKIHDASLDLRYRWSVSKNASIEFGPVLSVFHSRARIWHRSFSATDLRLGGVLQLNCALSGPWAVGVSYRYAAPPDRTLNVFALSVSYSP